MTANIFDSEPDFVREGMSARVVGQRDDGLPIPPDEPAESAPES